MAPAGRLRTLPLRWRLSMLTAALVLVALVLSAVGVLALVRSSLLTQVDDQLETAAQSYVDDIAQQPGGPCSDQDRPGRPSDYYVRVSLTNGCTEEIDAPTANARPAVPAGAADPGRGGEVTVPSTADDGPLWRLGYYPIEGPSGPVGSMVIAIPLSQVEKTVTDLVRTMVLVGVVVVALGASVGYLAVQRSLRPLRDVERAAEAVAAGDLGRRVTPEPASTEVGRLGLSFNTMVAGLERSFAEQAASEARMRRFVSDASHELRTPLASIRGYGELYRMGAVADDDVPGTLARIESEATRMGGLVNDLLALARLDEGRGLHPVEVDLVAIAADGVADLGALDSTRTATLLADGPVRLRADADRLRQVVTNLVGNVVQHTPAGSPVEVLVRPDDDGATAVLEVRDHGRGIAAEDSARVFERFYRPDSSRTRTSGGSGLGLAIVATIVAAHGGTVRHEPTPGGGATVVVRLPVEHTAPAVPTVPATGDGRDGVTPAPAAPRP